MAKSTSRWFRVTADRFDWMPKHGVMFGYRKGAIDFKPQTCINYGLALGAIEVIDKPRGYSVDKAGKVTKDAD